MIPDLDRGLLEMWSEVGGVPDDASTREFALKLLLKLWEDYKEVESTMMQLLDQLPPPEEDG